MLSRVQDRALLFALSCLTASVTARADLPPPPGQTRVSYSFRVGGKWEGVALVAFPMYTSGGGLVARIETGKDLTPFQGYTPGIYAMRAGDVASISETKDDAAVRKLLDEKARVCVKQVPRVFTVPTSTKVHGIVDVFTVEATPDKCSASLEKSLYRGERGVEGEGKIDASGRRVPPSPFGSELPPVNGIPASSASATPEPSRWSDGAASTETRATPTPSESRGGCAGCALGGVRPTESGPLVLAAWVALGALRRSRRRARAG